MSTNRVSVLGITFDPVTIQAAIEQIITKATDPKTQGAYITKPYVEFLDRAAGDVSLQQLINGAELVLADGIAAVWAAHFLYAGPHTLRRFLTSLLMIVAAPKRLGAPIPERIAGINFTWPLLESAAANGLRVALVGQTQTQIQHTARTLTAHLPQLNIVGTFGGYDTSMPRGQVGDGWLGELTRNLMIVKPDLILVGMGFPLQERVCAELARALPHGIAIGEGGTFDYEIFGGQRAKAPISVQRIGLEWAWRLLQQPQRLKRQLSIPRVILKVWRQP